MWICDRNANYGRSSLNLSIAHRARFWADLSLCGWCEANFACILIKPTNHQWHPTSQGYIADDTQCRAIISYTLLKQEETNDAHTEPAFSGFKIIPSFKTGTNSSQFGSTSLSYMLLLIPRLHWALMVNFHHRIEWIYLSKFVLWGM